MRKVCKLGLLVIVGMLLAVPVFSQDKQQPTLRQPLANAKSSPYVDQDQQPLTERHYRILNGLPMQLHLHHDTEVGTNAPVDVYRFVIEMQVMNSDRKREPIGLQIAAFYTKYPQDPNHVVNPNSAKDCLKWFHLQTQAAQNRDPKSKTWPYVEFVTRAHARIVQTNEDGAVYYSDDIECWGSWDRFQPF